MRGRDSNPRPLDRESTLYRNTTKRLFHAPAVYNGLTANGYGRGPRPCRQSNYSCQLWRCTYSRDGPSVVLIKASNSTQYFTLPMRKIHDSLTKSIPRWTCQSWPVGYRLWPTRGFVKYASTGVNRRIRSLVVGRERACMHAVHAVLAARS